MEQLSTNPTDIYDPDFFRMHVPWRSEYERIGDALCELLDFHSVLDIGCGNAFILSRMLHKRKTVLGVDGSQHALAAAPKNLSKYLYIHDLSVPGQWGQFDLVLCTEVAEHMTANSSDVLVKTICDNSRRYVFFTAATPGQGGRNHINEQPHDYWIAKFADNKHYLNAELTGILRERLQGNIATIFWFTNNALIFQMA